MDVEEAIKARFSVRKFAEEPVPRKLVTRLLDAARWAPCVGEPWRFVAVTEPERRERLGAAARQPWIAKAPVVVVVGVDLARLIHVGKRFDRNRVHTLYYIQDSAAAIQNLMLAAVAHGLGTCWIGSLVEGEVIDAVGFSATVRPVAMVPVGYPAAGVARKDGRRPLEEVLSWETYREPPDED